VGKKWSNCDRDRRYFGDRRLRSSRIKIYFGTMSTRLINLTTILVASIASSVFAHSAVAQVANVSNFNDATDNAKSTSSVFENIMTDNAGDFYQDSSMEGQLNNMFGWESGLTGSYAENEISEAGEKLNQTYNQLMKQQVGRDPVMRTRDLTNPFNTSVMENPNYLGGK
jgi:hypothetical protein